MNREIKFRAWDKKDKKWLFGYELLGGFSLLGELVLTGEIQRIQLKDLEDVEVMQYTGLKDKNGKEIYEGDIVRQIWDPFKEGRRPEIGVVTIEATRGVFIGNQPIWVHDCEVIGDIHQNPELLK